MNSRIRTLITCLAASGAVLCIASAQDQDNGPAPQYYAPGQPQYYGTSQDQQNGPYVKADLGGEWMQDVKIRDFFGVPLFPDSKLHLDPGVRAGISGGYQFCQYFALDGEIGYYGNRISSVTAQTYLHDSYYEQVPFMVNAKLQYPNASPFTPYIGAGAGFSVSILDIGHLGIMDTTGAQTSIHGSDSDAVFAWQAMAGLRYRLNDRMGLAVEYHFLWADSPSWHADYVYNTPSDRISLGQTRAHAFSIAFDFHF
ncbi:MAG TPA: porin family protein [Verrucomicrobiae bacterium]|nr:porin family protein [Verrucomicrobiae bacterium]